jgi:hypothetical protein
LQETLLLEELFLAALHTDVLAQNHHPAGTRFVPARVTDNAFNNPEYRKVLEGLSGWQKRAWLDGDWDLAAGHYFTTFRREVNVVSDFDETRAREWFAALDYGFAHYTVVPGGLWSFTVSNVALQQHHRSVAINPAP